MRLELRQREISQNFIQYPFNHYLDRVYLDSLEHSYIDRWNGHHDDQAPLGYRR
jgi:hypothetical protein